MRVPLPFGVVLLVAACGPGLGESSATTGSTDSTDDSGASEGGESDGGSEVTSADADATAETGDGDGTSSSGDGDGDGTSSSGDGDGTSSSGDGDGTSSSGDGDGTSSSGDGDGTSSGTTSGDGDGTSFTGDGDGGLDWTWSGDGDWGDGDGCTDGALGCTCLPGGTCDDPFFCDLLSNTCEPECWNDADCVGSPSTVGTCESYLCTFRPKCDDGLSCTLDVYDVGSDTCTFDTSACASCVDYRIEAEDQAIVFRQGAWSTPGGAVLSGGLALESSTVGDTLRTWTFGTDITVGYEAGPNRGVFEVDVDGTTVATVDAYQPNDFAFQVPAFVASGLPFAVHEVVIRQAGSNPPSSGSYVTIDFVDSGCGAP